MSGILSLWIRTDCNSSVVPLHSIYSSASSVECGTVGSTTPLRDGTTCIAICQPIAYHVWLSVCRDLYKDNQHYYSVELFLRPPATDTVKLAFGERVQSSVSLQSVICTAERRDEHTGASMPCDLVVLVVVDAFYNVDFATLKLYKSHFRCCA